MSLTEERVSTLRKSDSNEVSLAAHGPATEWTEIATKAAAGVAVVTKALVAGKSHYITAVHASFDDARIDILMWNFDGTINRHQVHNARSFIFQSPIKVTAATAAVASLNVASFNGDISISGYTA